MSRCSIANSSRFIPGQTTYSKKLNNALEARLDSLEARNESLEAENAKLASKLQFCEASLNNLEQYSRRECVKISGILEAEDENTREIVIKAIYP